MMQQNLEIIYEGIANGLYLPLEQMKIDFVVFRKKYINFSNYYDNYN